MRKPRKIKSGRFPSSDEAEAIAHLTKILAEGDSDWVQVGTYIGVKCFEDPSTFRIVIGKIVHEGDEQHP